MVRGGGVVMNSATSSVIGENEEPSISPWKKKCASFLGYAVTAGACLTKVGAGLNKALRETYRTVFESVSTFFLCIAQHVCFLLQGSADKAVSCGGKRLWPVANF